MYFPSERVRNQMLFEPSFLWFVPSESADTHAVLIKTHSNILKSIISGVKVQLFAGINEYKDERHFCLALRIYDDAAHPLLILKIQREEEEHLASWEIMKRKTTPIFFFDELCHCVAYTEAQFEERGISEITELIENPETLYVGEFGENTLYSMDCLDYTIDPSQEFKEARKIQVVDLGIKLGRFETWDISNFGIRENHKFRIETVEGEGENFEQRVWTALESIFPFGIYKSPQVVRGGKERELIDILCLAGDNMLLVEAKTLSIFKGNAGKTMEQKVSRLQKHVDKALGQLEGAIKQIKGNSRIYKKKIQKSEDAQEIKFTENQSLVPHALVIVSGILPYGDWSGYSQKFLQLSKNNHALFHLLDLPELMKIVVACSKSTYDFETMANAFDYHLSERFDAFVKSENIFIKVQFGE